MRIFGPRTMCVRALEGYPSTHELLLLDEDLLLCEREVHNAVHRRNGADVNQIIVKEKDVFTNVISPSSKTKLRLLLELAPLGFLIENARGYSGFDSWRDARYETMINAEVEYILTWVHRCLICIAIKSNGFGSSAGGCASGSMIR
ncbi:hypothetical protein NE237_000051 [Protea cynaroides]|uniref:Fructose-1-6-bisphosphatase class 1 C-terminal domain-containing protein n=1 Tax=Protea cynaroides TaxID=273540 RepID=A0A9Q0GL84_9MAGN|nr:hypothetical protein NE237_000051 [Protea cynaroides]